jgi:hypothetical protein
MVRVKGLIAAGLTEKVSEAIVNVVLHSRDDKHLVTQDQLFSVQREMANKSDIKEIKADLFDMKTDIKSIKSELIGVKTDIMRVESQIIKLESKLKAEIGELRSELKTETNSIRAEISNVKFDLLKWIIPMFMTNMGLIVMIIIKVML